MERKITSSLVNAFVQQLWEDEKSRSTIEKYKRDIRRFTAYAADRPMEKPLIVAYKADLVNTYAPASANSMLAALNAFLRFAGWCDCCVKQVKVQKKAYCSAEKELSKEEYRRLIGAAERKGDTRLSLLIQTICGTGIRVSELPFITVEAVRRGEAIVSCKGKTRTVFIVSALRRRLLKYAKEQRISTGSVFVTKRGNPMNRSNIWREMKALCRAAHVSPEKVFPHNLRHLFARTFYGIEKDIAKLADVLGHTSIDTTRIYIITTGAEHKRKLETMRLVL